MANDTHSDFNRMANIDWLVANADDRYPGLSLSSRQLAIVFGFHQSQISRMRGPKAERSMTALEVRKWLEITKLNEIHPEFQESWLDWPQHLFVVKMQSMSFGRWNGDQPLDSLSASLPALPNATLVEEDDLTRRIGRAARRGDIGADVAMDLESKGSIYFRTKFGIQLREPGPDMARAVVCGTTTCLLLYRAVRSPFFEAAPCAQRGCLHLLDRGWNPMRMHPVPARLQSQLVIIVAPETRDQRRPYGFAASNVTERVELLLAVFGQAIPTLQTWSERGGEGLPEQRESLLQHLASPITRERPRIAGRMLIDVVPPPPPPRK
jgi:hypothetical protein